MAGGRDVLVLGEADDIDLDARTIHLDVDAVELWRRRRSWRPLRRPLDSRWLRRYRALITISACGAVLRDPEEAEPVGERGEEQAHEHGDGAEAERFQRRERRIHSGASE